ncbi:MAG TPA: hypothetical protein QGH10_20955 [Armatimonadota bacterium]|nr:hypothetical protein [Armatimonadota bacterium]
MAARIACPKCGADNPHSIIVTTCAKCGSDLPDTPPPARPAAAKKPRARRFSLPKLRLRRRPKVVPVRTSGSRPQAWTKDNPPPRKPMSLGIPQETLARIEARKYDTWSRRIPSLKQPPRRVPVWVQVQCVLGRLSVQLGWTGVLVGLAGTWALLDVDWTDSAFKRHGTVTVDGIVTEVRAPLRGRDAPRPTAHEFRFTDDEGNIQTGTAYSLHPSFEEGDRVPVTHAVGKPHICRIDGMSASDTPWELATAALAMLPFGLWGCIHGSISGLRDRELLIRGKLGKAELISIELAGGGIHELVFEFEIDSGYAYRATVVTENVDALRDDPREPILYLPRNPRHAAMFDVLPGRPAIDNAGNLECGPYSTGVLALVLPVCAVVGWLISTVIWII